MNEQRGLKFSAAACWTRALVTRRAASWPGSPLLGADAENWLVNGAISSAVLLSFVSVYLIQQTRFSHLTPYIDPLLVLTVVLISILFPIRMAWQALMELLNRAPPSNLSNKFVSLSCPCCPNWILKKILRAVK